MKSVKNGVIGVHSGKERHATAAELSGLISLYSSRSRFALENGMIVDVIYRQRDGTQSMLGTRQLSHMPPAGEPFELDQKQYIARAYAGPDAAGRYRLFLEDDTGGKSQAATH